MSGEVILVKDNEDFNLPYAINIGTNKDEPIPGTIRYNAIEDRFEGYMSNLQLYNNSYFAPLNLEIASTTRLGGIKVGNNLAITSTGVLNAVAESSTQKFQKILSVSPFDNVADYTSINQCLSDFFGYNSVSDTFPDGELAGLDPSDYPSPSASVRYIIHLMPGTYTESGNTINLPPYVSLIGEDRDSVFINVDNTTQINCYSNRNGGQAIGNLTINMDNTQTATTTVIETTNCSNILLENIKFTMSTPSGYDYNVINMSSGSGNELDKLICNISGVAFNNNENINFLVASAASTKLKDCDLSVSGFRGTKKFISATSDSTIEMFDTTLTLIETNTTNSSHRNECIFLEDSDLTVKRCDITCNGYDLLLNDNTHNNRTVVINNTGEKTTTTQTITFVHYEDASQYDEILCVAASLDFTSLFSVGDNIKVSGASQGENNSYFKIINIYSEEITGTEYSIIQVGKNDILKDETTTAGVTIKSLYDVSIANSQLQATNNLVAVLDSNNNYFMRISNSDLEGDKLSIGSNKIIFNAQQIIKVGKQNADFSSIADAVDSINDNDTIHRYLIYVLPGIYYETQQIVLPEYVSLVGENKQSVRIIFDTNNGSYADNVAIKVNNYSTVENITLEQSAKLDSSVDELILIGSDNLDVVEASAADIIGVELYNLQLTIQNNDALDINFIKLMKTTSTINKVFMNGIVKGSVASAQTFIGYNLILGEHKIYDTKIQFSGTSVETADTTGFYNDRVVSTIENPIVNVITSGSSSVVNIAIKVDNTEEADITLTDISNKTNIVQGGILRSYNGTANYSAYSNYNSTIFLNNLSFQGDTFLRNNEDGDYPNSVLKVLSCYAITVDGSNNIIDLSTTDVYGNSSTGSDNVVNGQDAGSINMNGNGNVLFGLRIGQKLLTGSRNIMMGVDVGNNDYSLSDNVLIGYQTGNVLANNKNVLIGSKTGNEIIEAERTNIIGYKSGSTANNITNVNIFGIESGSNLDGASNTIVIGNNSANQLGDGINSVLIGNRLVSSMIDGERNIIIGDNALSSITDVDDLVAVGANIASNASTISATTLIGFSAGKNIDTLTGTTLIGHNSTIGNEAISTTLQDTVIIGNNNASNISGSVDKLIVLGSNIGNNITDTANRNILIGNDNSVNALTTGSNNIVMGSNTAPSLTTGSRNIILGNDNAANLDTTSDIIIIGNNSGSNISGSGDTNNKSIVIGNDAAQNFSGSEGIFIGHEAGKNAVGEETVVIGNRAGRTITGARNLLIGNYTAGISADVGTNPVEGHDNILFGTRSGFSIKNGNYNIVIGSGDSITGGAGNNLSNGSGNFIMGYLAGNQISDGDYNLLLGRNAGKSLSLSNRNVIIGDNAGRVLGSNDNVDPNSDDNVIIGNNAAYNLTLASDVVIIGPNAGYNATAINNSMYIGTNAGYTNVTGSDNLYMGSDAGYLNTGSQNTMAGTNAGKYSTTALYNTFLGYNAGSGKSALIPNTGDQNIAIGYNALSNVVSGYQSVAIGNNAGRNNEDGNKNIMLGPNAGINSSSSKSIFIGSTDNNDNGVGMNTTGNYNTFIGINAGEINTSGAENIFVGSHAGSKNTTGSNDIFIGNDAGMENIDGDGNIKIGKEAGRDATTGDNNVIIGSEANKVSAGSNNAIIIGKQAGMYNTADNQIFIGAEAGKNNTTGTGSIMIGPQAGKNNEAGKNNIFIGHNTGSAFHRTSDTQGENIYIGSNIGINNTTGIHNIVIGTETFEQSSNGSGVIAIGYRAGKNTGVTNAGDDYNNIMIGTNAVSEGDIGLNNTMIGSNVGRNVDNVNKFIGNAMIGADAGKNANLAINSVILGNSGRVGTGGEDNIMAGFSAGENLGNPTTITVLTTTTIVTNDMYVELDLPYQQTHYYFKSGDVIFIKYGTTTFETEIGYIYDNGSGGTLITFNNYYTGSTTIEIGASVFSLARLSNNVGVLDNSKSSSNTLMGTAAGYQLESGSKCVALGSSALYKNKSGKYNNILGTQAGYSVRSDNNTCYGTRAGYSIDEYSYTNNTASTDLKFFSDTNKITSVSNNLSSYDFGSVFELEGSTSNDGRYIVKSSNSSEIIVNGLPEISEIGIPTNIKSTDIRINTSEFTFYNYEINGKTESFISNINGNYLYTSNSSKFADLSNIGIINVSGSIYNNGYHYIDTSNSSVGTLKLFNEVYNETLTANTTIKTNSITTTTGSSSIETIEKFEKINSGSPMYVYFGANKGVYYKEYMPITGILGQPSNYSIYLSTPITTNLMSEDNIVFTTGHIQSSVNYNNKKKQIFSDMIFTASNNTIYFSDAVLLDTSTSNAYFKISGTNDNNGIIKISSIGGSNQLYTIDSNYSLTDETINADASNVVIFEKYLINDLNRTDLSDDISNRQIINMTMATNSDVSDNKSRFTEGAFIVENISSNKLNLNNIIEPKQGFNGSDGSEEDLIINKNSYSVDESYLLNNDKIKGYDFIYQTGNIVASNSNFDLNTGSNTITTTTDFEFTKIVAPVMIDIGGTKYLVKKNIYPFNTLYLDESFNPITTNSNTDTINYHSISTNHNTMNFNEIMTTGIEYTVFGGINHLKTIEAANISNVSVYLTSGSNIITDNTNNMIISVATDYQYTDFNGYFKNYELNNIANVDITVSAPNLVIDFQNATYPSGFQSNIIVGDFIQLSGASLSNNNDIFEVVEVGDFSIPSVKNITVTNILGSAESDFTASLRINQFRLSHPVGTIKFDFDDLYNKTIGEMFRFLRFNKTRDINDGTSIFSIADKSLNFATYYDSTGGTFRKTSNVVVLSETVPSDDYLSLDADSSVLFSAGYNWNIAIGTPVLDFGSNTTLETENINTGPIGYINIYNEYIRNIDPTLDTTSYIFNSVTSGLSGNIAFSNTHITLSNIVVDTGNVSYNDIEHPIQDIYVNNVFEPFKNVKAGELIMIEIYQGILDKTYTFMVDEVISPTQISINSNFIGGQTSGFGDTSLFNAISLNQAFNGGADYFKIKNSFDLGYTYVDDGLSNVTVKNYGQIVSDRYDFKEILQISFDSNVVVGTLPTDYYSLQINKLPYIYKNDSFYVNGIDSIILDKPYLKPITSNTTIISGGTTRNVLEFLKSIDTRDGYLLDNGVHSLVIPTSNLTSSLSTTNLSFNVVSKTGLTTNLTKNTSTNSTIEITAGGDTTDLEVGNIIKYVRDTTVIGYYKIISLTSSTITIDNNYNNIDATVTGDTSIKIETNTINSSNVSEADLSVYKPGEKLIISKTTNNNGVYLISKSSPTSNNSIYMTTTLVDESPSFCNIEKSVLTDETSSFTFNANLTVDGSDSSNSEISLTGVNSNSFVEFIPNQIITISGATDANNNNTFTISNTLPTSNVIKAPIGATETVSSITIAKNTTLSKIGSTVTTTIDTGISKYHYLDSQGNNLMLGSFAGHYSGANSLSTHNIYIGPKVGQTNHGSGNIFFGNETLFADNKDDGSTTYNNKFAVYKNNFIGVSSNPLIGGDFGSGRVGINTIDPDSLASSGTLSSETKLVVNGSVRASAHSTFTGTHNITTNSNKLKPGMCMVSSGKSKRLRQNSILDTIVDCIVSTTENDKRVYGIYSHTETINGVLKHYVASVGEGMILVSNINGEPENGDYVSTSPIRGLSQLQADDLLHNYTVAKITEDIDWTTGVNTVIYNGTKYKYKLVSCTYHCG